jgi:trans-2,3-dihydro-3-hydroxyanthranilate isomerase
MRSLLVPVRNVEVLERCRPRWHLLDEISTVGGYCFTAAGAGRVRARGFFPGVGIPEDPATGAAAAALGVYLADRLGAIEMEMMQGVEMGRPSHIYLKAAEGRVHVGGRVTHIFSGRLEQLP